MIAAIVSWAILMLGTLLTGFFSGWALLATGLLGRLPQFKVIIALSVVVAITIGMGWLVARLFASARRVGKVVGSSLAIILVVWIGWSVINPDRALFLAREVGWGDSTIQDFERFPQRAISNAAPAFHFQQNLSPELLQTISYRSNGELKQMSFEDFLQSTQTTSFIVIKDDSILYEGYSNGYRRDSIVTSFSVAKSFTSALVGIAIDEGYIKSVDDLMIDYIPELKGKGFDNLTIRHLLTMSSGIQFLTDDELPALKEIFQFTDEGMSYSYPDRRSLILQVKPDGKPLASEFNYNNYNTILLGMILERTTGRSPSEYLQEKIWKPLGMEYPASWSLESEKSGFELMVAGINARAIDFAKFGRLFLNNGNWNDTQIISPDWVIASTSPNPDDHRVWHSDVEWKELNGYYKYQWWGRYNADGTYHYTAQGHLGQFIFVAPQENMVIVRFGFDHGGVDDWMSVFQTITAQVSTPGTKITNTSSGDWLTSTPEEQGFDSAKAAEGLLAIKEDGTAIHSLTVLRNDKVILDAYFYPYDGSIYHDLGSVTKSVMTTLIGIAADQGKLSLDDTMLSFFPGREIANLDKNKEKITLRHLASMSSGLDCDPRDDEVTMGQMRATGDWVQFTLDLPVVQKPGSRFRYCSPNMHLLSAILQQATGMSALEFANQHLFGPLGIQDVYWPADPQGVTHGWGDLCLRPPDMAKLGSLYMHNGKWHGQQIVSQAWVESALKDYMDGTGKVEDYGYGWWIGQPSNEPEFLATGNGGQKIKVYPRLKLIVVTTGAGFEYSEIEPYFLPMIGNLEKPLPANPTGIDSLHAALNAIAEGPEPQPGPTLPVTANVISGQTYVFEPNDQGLLSIGLDFNDSAEAIFRFEVANESGPRVIGIGLDGVYRNSHAGRPIIARGSWKDAQTFVIDYNEGPGKDVYVFTLHFDGDAITFNVSGLGSFKANKK
jgi:CubicO group peptidase (beta-lactamase class C family)